MARKIQPMELPGRREAIKAPTVAKARNCRGFSRLTIGWEGEIRTPRYAAEASKTNTIAHTSQENQARKRLSHVRARAGLAATLAVVVCTAVSWTFMLSALPTRFYHMLV